MGLINRTAAALLATTALCGVAYAQSQPTITPGTVIQPGFVEGLFGGKVDVNNGTAANLTSTGGTFASPTLTGIPTAPTPASTSGATQIATKGYVDNAAGSNGGVAQQCTIANVGGLEAMTFAAKAELSCYNLTLTQANPTLTISGGLAGAYQRTTVLVKEPATNSYAWTLPTSTSGNVVVLGNVVPLITAGAITQFTATTYDGGNNIYITGGSGTGTAPTTTSATALTLDTPAQARPNASITLTGTYTGSPQSLDYNFGSGWIQAQNPIFTNGVFSVVVSSGEAAGTYAPQIRDHYTTSVTATAGQFIASAWTPGTLSTSPGAAAVFEFNANNPALAPTTTGATVAAVANSLNTSQLLQSEMGATGNPVLIAHNQGSDSHHRLLQFHATTIGSNITDPAANWLGAGGVSGMGGSALVNLANSTNASANGSFTTVVAMNIDKTYIYESGPIWGAPMTPGPIQYAQIRANISSNVMGASYHDATGAQPNAQGAVTAGWHVFTMIKNGAVLTYRLDGQQVATAVDTSTGSFTATDFMLGGGFPTDGTAENGAPPPYLGEFQAYSGVLSGTDLANAEMLAGNSIGLTLNPTVPTTVTVANSLTVTAPSNVVTGTQFSVAGTYTGGPPTALDVSVDGGAYTAVVSPSISGGTYSFTEAALTSAGSHTVSVRDHNAPTVISTAVSFTVSAPAATGVTAMAFNAAPTNCVAYQACTFTGTYTGSNAASLDYQLDAQGWATPTINTYTNGQFSFTIPGLVTATAGAHTMQVRDHTNTSVVAQVSFTEATPATTSTAATALTVDTPAQTRPGTAFTVTGTFSGGQSTALDWSSDGSTWTSAFSPTISTGSSGSYSFTVSAGIATTGTYKIYVRDDNAKTVQANSGNFVVNSFTPSALASSPSAAYVWGFDANNQSSVPAASDGSVSQVFNNLPGSSSQYLAARQGSSAVKVIATRQSGSDGAHRVIQFAPSTTGAPTAADPAANWLSAGGTSGTAGTALLNLANSSNLSTNGAFTAIEAVQVDTSKPYETMMAWGQPPSPGPYNVARIRWKKTDNALGAQVYGVATSSATVGGTGSTAWMVVTIVKDASGNLTYRQNGTVVGTATMNLTNTFTSTDFMLGGDFAGTNWPTPTGEGGLPPPYIGAFEAYSGTLSAADLANAEMLAGSSVGLNLNLSAPTVITTATALTVNSPTGVVTGSAFNVAGTYTGGPPVALDASVDGGAYTAVSNPTISAGSYSFTEAGLSAAGTHTVSVRDHNATTVTSSAASFTVTASSSTSATAISVDTPAQTQPSTAFAITGTYSGGQTTALDWSTDNSTWTAAASPTISTGTAGTFSFNVAAGLPTAGTYKIYVRDHIAQTIVSSSGNFVVAAFKPSTLSTSPGAAFVWGFDANNQSLVPAASDGSITKVYNAANASQYLTSVLGGSAVKIVAARLTGGDGMHRVIQFNPTTLTSPANGDPTTNYLDAGANAGTTLINLANSTAEKSNGALTYIVAVKVDTSKGSQEYGLWGSENGTAAQYTHLRYNHATGQIGANINDASGAGVSAGQTASTAWQVMTLIKDASGNVTYRVNGTSVATAADTSTGAFTGTDFTIGAGVSATAWFGSPAPYVGAMQAYSGVLAGTDLTNAERMVGSAIGVTW